MSNYDWTETFRHCYDKAVVAYAAGHREPTKYFDAAETAFLASIGCSAQEMYDYVEDAPELSYDMALLITAVRRDYFLVMQKGQVSQRTVRVEDFPAKDAELAGFAWLPRIIVKARGKLRGEMPNELMYCCGGDRKFLKSVHLHPADFLRMVWAAKDDDQKIIDCVKQSCQSV